jgi:hypothetical protein
MRTAVARIKRLTARDTEERREREASRPITLPKLVLPRGIKAELNRIYGDTPARARAASRTDQKRRDTSCPAK